MFTGLVEARVPALALVPRGGGARLTLSAPVLPPDLPAWQPRLGESLSVSGCCLTVSTLDDDGTLGFDLSAETLARTWFSDLADRAPGRTVNLERAVRLADRLGGHLVSGHVDGLATITSIEDVDPEPGEPSTPGDEEGLGGRLFTFEVPAAFERYLIDKGSVAVDGISLTVVAPRGRLFDVAIIPETLRRTSLGTADVGQRVHLEADQIGKWVERLLAL